MELVLLTNNLKMEQQNGIIAKYHIAISKEAVYLIHSSNDYFQTISSLFSEIGNTVFLFGEIALLFGSPLVYAGGALIGGILIEEVFSAITNTNLSNKLSNFVKNRSDKRIKTVLKNLDKYAKKNKGVSKLDFENIKQFTYKKSFIFNGNSFVEFTCIDKKYKLFLEHNSQIDELLIVLKNYASTTKITSQLF